MEILSILFNQILLMFLLMFVGVWLCKTNRLTLEGSKALGNILLYTVIPMVVIKAFMTEMTPERLKGLMISFVVSLLALILSMVVSHFCFKNNPIENFGTSFSNAGFIGIPLVSAMFGSEAVFYVSSFVALLNILQWTYGVFVMTKSTQSIAPKKIITNPIVISLAIGLVLFITQIQLPSILVSGIHSIAALNSPLAMFTLGTYLSQLSFKDIFTSRLSYRSSFVRLLVIPILTLVLLSFIPNEYLLMRNTILMVASTPIGSNVAIFAQMYEKDYTQAVKDVCMTTLLSIITIPVIVMISSMIW